MEYTEDLPPKLKQRLTQSQSVRAITGAGISAESGISTYRGKGGIYDDPEEGDRTVESLSGPTLAADPDRTWRTLAALARQTRDAKPNAGHLALAEIEKSVADFVLLTQNVDGLHRQAGSKEMIEIHGHIFDTLCPRCRKAGHIDDLATLEKAPSCPECDGTLRPDVVLFGEMLDHGNVQRLHRGFYEDVGDLLLIIGTTALFPYISEPVAIARQRGKLTIEINPEPTVVSNIVDYSLRGAGGHWLPKIAAAIKR